MNVSDNIKAIRLAKGLTQAEVARRYDTSPEFYHRLEKKGDSITLEQLRKIALALEVPLTDLLTWEGDTHNNHDATNNSQLQKRIEELEDRLKDKEKLNRRAEHEIDRLKFIFGDYIWDKIHDEAKATSTGVVHLEYSNPERSITVTMDTYVRSLKDEKLVDESYHSYGIELTDTQLRETFYKLLRDETFKDFVAEFYRAKILVDETLVNLFTEFTTNRSSFKKRT